MLYFLCFPVFRAFMHLFTSEEAIAWCAERGIKLDPDLGLHYGSAPKRRLDVTLPNGVQGLLYAARSLARLETRGLYASEQYQQEFAGCLLWVTGHGHWSPATEQLGAHIFNRLGVHAGRAATLDQYPARYFASADLIAAEASILQPLLFQWDAYVIPETGNYIATISHDGSIRGIIARTPDILSAVKDVFAEFDVHDAFLPPDVIHARS